MSFIKEQNNNRWYIYYENKEEISWEWVDNTTFKVKTNNPFQSGGFPCSLCSTHDEKFADFLIKALDFYEKNKDK